MYHQACMLHWMGSLISTIEWSLQKYLPHNDYVTLNTLKFITQQFVLIHLTRSTQSKGSMAK